MIPAELEELINAVTAKGTVTERERRVLYKRAIEEGVDPDELQVVLDAKLYRHTNPLPAQTQSYPSQPQTKPHTQIDFDSYSPRYEVEPNACIELFSQLHKVDMEKIKRLMHHNAEKNRLIGEMKQRHGGDKSFDKTLDDESRESLRQQEKDNLMGALDASRQAIERDAIEEKKQIIKAFPIPNTKKSLLNLLVMAANYAYDNDGVVGEREKAWLEKTGQIYQKIVLCAGEDREFLLSATLTVVSLMKRLPRSLKNFTEIAPSLRKEMGRELEADRESIQQKKLQAWKRHAIWGAPFLILGIIFLFFFFWIGVLFIIVSFVAVFMAKRDVQKINNNPFR